MQPKFWLSKTKRKLKRNSAMEIIPGLPNDLSRECLLRVPCSSHYKLTSVCNSWENIVTNPRFYKNRKKFGASQELIILSVRVDNDFTIKLYDPLQKSLETLPPIPLRHTYFSDCVSVNHKLFVMGFLNREELLLSMIFLMVFSCFSQSTYLFFI